MTIFKLFHTCKRPFASYFGVSNTRTKFSAEMSICLQNNVHGIIEVIQSHLNLI